MIALLISVIPGSALWGAQVRSPCTRSYWEWLEESGDARIMNTYMRSLRAYITNALIPLASIDERTLDDGVPCNWSVSDLSKHCCWRPTPVNNSTREARNKQGTMRIREDVRIKPILPWTEGAFDRISLVAKVHKA